MDSLSLHFKRTIVFTRESEDTEETRKGGTGNVMDRQRRLNRDVVVGNGVVVHHGWVYSHPARDRNRNRVATVDQRPPNSLSRCEGKPDAKRKRDSAQLKKSSQPFTVFW